LERGRKLKRLRKDQEAAMRLLSREMNKKDWDRAGVLAEINNETLRDLMDFREPGSYDRFYQGLLRKE